MSPIAAAFSWLGALVTYLDTPSALRALGGDAEQLARLRHTWPRSPSLHEGWRFEAPDGALFKRGEALVSFDFPQLRRRRR